MGSFQFVGSALYKSPILTCSNPFRIMKSPTKQCECGEINLFDPIYPFAMTVISWNGKLLSGKKRLGDQMVPLWLSNHQYIIVGNLHERNFNTKFSITLPYRLPSQRSLCCSKCIHPQLIVGWIDTYLSSASNILREWFTVYLALVWPASRVVASWLGYKAPHTI